MTNKKKIINDPVHGFITIPSSLIYDIIAHPYFQRLRRIRQLGLTDMVYPGALHTRFHHALGAMHLMGRALEILRSKGHFISSEEQEAAQIAILLHDIGHGPFSHALESTILRNVPHEALSRLLMEALNEHFGGGLALAIQMFSGTYERPFFHQLISSQLDMDRLDYLQRDCFFTGVLEGTIGAERILKMLEIHDNRLVVEEKGIYSIESFLTARRLMYWQVYLHKTTISAEKMIIQIIRRARYVWQQGGEIFASPSLRVFMEQELHLADFRSQPSYLQAFANLDDFDLWGAIKIWAAHPDKILAELCRMLLERRLFKIVLSKEPFEQSWVEEKKAALCQEAALQDEDWRYFLVEGHTENAAYQEQASQILIKTKQQSILDIAEASDLPNIKALTKIVKKYYVCWAQHLSL